MRLSMQQGFGQERRTRSFHHFKWKTQHQDRFYWDNVSRGIIQIENRELYQNIGPYRTTNDARSLICLPLIAQCYKSLVRRKLEVKHMKHACCTYNWLRIQTDVLMKCNWRVARLRSKGKEGDLLHSSPTWFEKAYQSLDSIILTIQIA